MNSSRIDFPYLVANQSQKHVTVNEALRRLDAVVQLSVVTATAIAQPGAPSDGDVYILPAGKTGADWATMTDLALAYYVDGAWTELIPKEGWRAFVQDTDELLLYDGAAWGPVSRWGVNANADATNRLSVKSNAVLFDAIDVAEGGNGDAQVKVNKEAASDTASHLFQTGFSGRAEFGLTGDDDFHLKVSADGAAWKNALIVDKSTGFVGFGVAPTTAQVQSFRTGAGGSDARESVHFEVENAYNLITYSCYRDAGTSTAMSPFFILRCSRGTKAAPAASQITDWVGGFAFRPYVAGATNNFVNRALFFAEIDDVVSGNSVPVSLVFSTSPTSGGSERMRIKSDGKIGIGTASPSTMLDVNGPVRVKSYTVAGLPPAATEGAGAIIYVPNEAGGATIAFSDGANWRRVADRAVVS